MTEQVSVEHGIAELASEAYVVGFPLVFDLEQVDRVTRVGLGAVPPTPYNSFGHARTLAGPETEFVSVNNDTVYSIAQLDLGVGPLLLEVPATGDRYYVLQFVDAWTNNFAYVGTRATGSAAGRFLLVPPEGEGEGEAADADGATVIRFPTRIGTIVGRWAVAGEDDLPAVHALQDALTLTQTRESFAPGAGVPEVAPAPSEALTFFERMRVWSQAFPPAEHDRRTLATYAPLGLAGPTPAADLPEDVRDALEEGYAVGKQALESSLHTAIPPVDGWQVNLHVFDYNVDFFEVGAIDSPAWQLPDPTTRYAHRAAAALGGLWGNHGYEAAYFPTYVDADGEALTGEHEYRLRLHPTPPVGAFWSVTMYDLPQYYLVDNPIGRYSLGDRTPGIVYDADGGLTITMSAARPADDTAVANWLPAPQGAFRPLLRLYAPGPAVLDGSYRLSPIERVATDDHAGHADHADHAGLAVSDDHRDHDTTPPIDEETR
ncbi:DUF1254 domain-containing protein [Leifsonia shinshuensis]|uniref:DUF1254 domain-containing protein n=1 Tax=Leifsonia shinshuensis TaxID=150026 RepID=UPI001F511B08|nr:DUF1254 domain-containing protein [Leifsonia shinshuensis]MCI0157354.1 DUF1254 domain-containing protein [Leifsonia shinshuensis]